LALDEDGIGMMALAKELALLGALFALVGCHVAESKEKQLAKAKAAVLKAAEDEVGLLGKPVIKTIYPSKGEGDGLLGTVCGSILDTGVAAEDQKPQRFIYMAIDKDILFEQMPAELLKPETEAEQKLIDDAIKGFNELWSDGCA
jgi:hypothetical protein